MVWVFLSDKTDDYGNTKAYDNPEVKQGEKVCVEEDDKYNGEGIVTVARPTGYMASQKSFFYLLYNIVIKSLRQS